MVFTCLGMLSKAKGQILRIAATLHVLFHWETPHNIPSDISIDALKAAINFVDLSTQHVAFLAGRGDIGEAVHAIHEMVLGKHYMHVYNILFSFVSYITVKEGEGGWV